MARATLAFVGMALSAALASGCARTQARIVPAPPPLDMPAPPPRMVEPVLAELPPAPDNEAEPPPASTEARPAPTAQQKPPVRTEPSRADAPTNEAAGTEPSRAPQAATLQTIPPSKEGQVQRSIRVHLDSAIANLNRVDYRTLSAEGRANFEQTRRFIAQAEEALRTKNLVFAATVADKAATLAAQLAGR